MYRCFVISEWVTCKSTATGSLRMHLALAIVIALRAESLAYAVCLLCGLKINIGKLISTSVTDLNACRAHYLNVDGIGWASVP